MKRKRCTWQLGVVGLGALAVVTGMATSAHADPGQGELMRAEHSNAEQFQAPAEVVVVAAEPVAVEAVAVEAAVTQEATPAGGANEPGVYTSTADGTPSANGDNGNGNAYAIGRPCAGCVGNADDKNPPGQQPGPSDPNAGYECDTNRGVGRGNPAHSPCVEATAPPVAPPVAPPDAPVLPREVVSAPPAVAAEVLARTGLPTSELAMIGLGLVLAGMVVLGVARRFQGPAPAARGVNQCTRRRPAVETSWRPYLQPALPVRRGGYCGAGPRERSWHRPQPHAWLRAGSAAHHRKAIGAHL